MYCWSSTALPPAASPWSRAHPLDSAVILSPEGSRAGSANGSGGGAPAAARDASFKLYARDIVKHPLTAYLVTVSACNGSGTRAYSGEGLVGLSWAFLRAGAHNVIGALWEVTPPRRSSWTSSTPN